MNKCLFSGRFTKDPVVRTTQSGVPVASFSLAVDRPGTTKENKVTDFFDFVVWGGKDGPGRAGVIEKYFHKGDPIVITDATAQTRRWTDKNGAEHTSVEFVVRDFEFAMGKSGGQAAKPADPKAEPEAFTKVEDEKLPF